MNNTRRRLPITRSRIEQIFPKLTPAQIGRIEWPHIVRDKSIVHYPGRKKV
jgi:hypothetical protein